MIPKAPRRAALAAALLLLAGAPMAAPAQPADDRGALLYDTHCIGCHGTQAHWRDRRLVTDWPSLNAQVRRWQETTGGSAVHAATGQSFADVVP